MKRLLIIALILLAPCISSAGSREIRAMMGMWGAASAPSGPFLSDTFTETSTVNITSHTTTEIGGAWSYDTNLGGSTASVNTTGGVANTTIGTAVFVLNSATPPSTDYTVSTLATYSLTSWDAAASPCARMDGAGNGYCVRVEPSSSAAKLAIVEKATGTLWYNAALLTSTTFSMTTKEYLVTLTVAGSTITATMYDGSTTGDAVLKTISTTDSTITDAGHAGLMFGLRTGSIISSITAE